MTISGRHRSGARRWLPTLLPSLMLVGLCACRSGVPGPERTRVRISVPSDPITYLPIYLARELGYYQDEGVDAIIDAFPGGSKGLQALLGGSVDVAASFFENTIALAAEGRHVKSFLTLLDRPGFVLAVSPASSRGIKRIEDLKGSVIGVTTPGSGSQHFVNYLLIRHKMQLKDVSITGIGLGSSSVAAIERGHIDAGILAGSAITVVQHHFPKLVVLADTRTSEGVKEVFGTDVYPAHDLLASAEWLRNNPAAARKLTHAVMRAMQWMREHSPEEMRAHMPAQYRAPDAEADLEALRATIPMLSRDGTVSRAGAEAVKRVLAVSFESVRSSPIDIAQLYTNEFADLRR